MSLVLTRTCTIACVCSHPELALPTFESFSSEAPEAPNAGQELELPDFDLGISDATSGEAANGEEDSMMKKIPIGSMGFRSDEFNSFGQNGETPRACMVEMRSRSRSLPLSIALLSFEGGNEAYEFSDHALQKRQNQLETVGCPRHDTMPFVLGFFTNAVSSSLLTE